MRVCRQNKKKIDTILNQVNSQFFVQSILQVSKIIATQNSFAFIAESQCRVLTCSLTISLSDLLEKIPKLRIDYSLLFKENKEEEPGGEVQAAKVLFIYSFIYSIICLFVVPAVGEFALAFFAGETRNTNDLMNSAIHLIKHIELENRGSTQEKAHCSTAN